MEPWFSAAAAAAAAGCCLVVLFFFCAFFAFWSKMVKIHVANWHAAGASEAGLNTKKKTCPVLANPGGEAHPSTTHTTGSPPYPLPRMKDIPSPVCHRPCPVSLNN